MLKLLFGAGPQVQGEILRLVLRLEAGASALHLNARFATERNRELHLRQRPGKY
ncbi:hypothetical protein [Neolewinella aurantiaca]|uniref:hypothetical protein n=1 Tax=Neolewinella aurantiaca TaxID=2602767 RepID=UPI00164FD1EC|nr:hypothetical protein [Neolewinella aurantiaca]